jgi:hypothetical protein
MNAAIKTYLAGNTRNSPSAFGYPASHGEMKDSPHGSRTAEVTTPASGRNSSVENG